MVLSKKWFIDEYGRNEANQHLAHHRDPDQRGLRENIGNSPFGKTRILMPLQKKAGEDKGDKLRRQLFQVQEKIRIFRTGYSREEQQCDSAGCQRRGYAVAAEPGYLFSNEDAQSEKEEY